MRMLRTLALTLFLGTVFLNISAADFPADVLLLEEHGGGHGKDSLNSKTTTAATAGVKMARLNISAAMINPDLNKVAHWDTIDINMYHVDMGIFNDTLSYTLHSPGNEFTPPHDGTVTSGFGPRKLFGRKFHKGIDIDLETGDEVSAAMGGKVRIARYSSGYGNFVVISHQGGLETLYGHMSELKVTEGEMVDAGQLIGLGGSTGQSTGSHLHFELRIFGEQVDPARAINPKTFLPWDQDIQVDASWFNHLSHAKTHEYHFVEAGETLDTICKMYEMDEAQMLQLNDLAEGAEVTEGMRLKVE